MEIKIFDNRVKLSYNGQEINGLMPLKLKTTLANGYYDHQQKIIKVCLQPIGKSFEQTLLHEYAHHLGIRDENLAENYATTRLKTPKTAT